MTENIPQPGDNQPERGDLYIAYKRRRRRWILIGTVLSVILSGLGYGVYDRFFSLDHLISQVKDCDIARNGEVPDRCKKALRKLIKRLPGKCPQVLAAIKKEPDRFKKNRLLFALVSSRIVNHPSSNGLNSQSVRSDRCIEDAVIHVHQSLRHFGHDRLSSDIAGVSPYNQRNLATMHNWGIRVRILARLAPKSLRRAFLYLVPKHEGLDNCSDPAVRKAARAAIREHVEPAMGQLYRQALKGPDPTPGLDSSYSVADGFPSAFIRLLGARSHLFNTVLNTYLARIHYGEQWHSALSHWHLQLLKRLSIQPRGPALEMHRELVRRVFARRNECHSGALTLLGEFSLGKAPPKGMQRWLRRVVQRAALDRRDSTLAEALSSLAQRSPHWPILSELMYLQGLKFDFRLDSALEALHKKDRHAARELVRSYHLARLLFPRKIDSRAHPRSIQYYQHLWLSAYLSMDGLLGIPAKSASRKDWPRSLSAWQKWGEQHPNADVRSAFTRERASIEVNLRHKKARRRFHAPLATIRLPFAKRLALLRPGLGDKIPSVRAMTALALSLGVTRRAEVHQLVGLLQRLAKDDDWTVKLVAFNRLAALKRPELLTPLINDTAPPIVQSYGRLLESWPTPKLARWLDRKDHGAGLALMVLNRRHLLQETDWKKPDYKKLNAMAKRKSSWVRYQLLFSVRRETWRNIDWSPLFSDPSVVVRYHALQKLIFFGKGSPGAARYVPHAIARLQDRNLAVVVEAAVALGQLQQESALPALKKLIRHPACKVRRAVQTAVATLEGKPAPSMKCIATALISY